MAFSPLRPAGLPHGTAAHPALLSLLYGLLRHFIHLPSSLDPPPPPLPARPQTNFVSHLSATAAAAELAQEEQGGQVLEDAVIS